MGGAGRTVGGSKRANFFWGGGEARVWLGIWGQWCVCERGGETAIDHLNCNRDMENERALSTEDREDVLLLVLRLALGAVE